MSTTKKTPRDYQQAAVDLAMESLKPGSRLMIASPTGTGKSFMEMMLKAKVPNSVILSPSTEILRHYAIDLGIDVFDVSRSRVTLVAAVRHVGGAGHVICVRSRCGRRIGCCG